MQLINFLLRTKSIRNKTKKIEKTREKTKSADKRDKKNAMNENVPNEKKKQKKPNKQDDTKNISYKNSIIRLLFSFLFPFFLKKQKYSF